MFPLPELIPLPEATTDMMGLLNLRGQIIPMMHLDLLQGQTVESCYLTDYAIVVQWDGLQFGLVVPQVDEVLELDNEVIETDPSHELLSEINTALMAGVAKVDVGNILLLNPKTLTGQLDTVLPLIWDAQMQLDVMAASPISVEQPLEQEGLQEDEELQTSKTLSSFYDLYCPNATPEERAIFRQRADNLRPQVESVKVKNDLLPLAVIGLNNEYFGLDLELVREFTDIGNLTPIPCCPNHIVGNMNLRGEIVTLVNIRNVLNLPTTSVGIGSQVVVVQVDDIVAGLPVDQVLEMAYLSPTDAMPSSELLSDFNEQYLQATTLFQEKMLRVLDLPKIFTEGGLAVNEEA
jgi:purine-binding chemotaxis protein CheW